MKIKVCGMREPANIEAVAQLQPDYMGFIFHMKSPRYFGACSPLDPGIVNKKKITNVGVFVNELAHNIHEICNKWEINHVQLHGSEPPEVCAKMREKGYTVIKAFPMSAGFDLRKLEPYKNCCDLFLFDSKTDTYGGSGRTFEWGLLREYDQEVPFFLSGGIGVDEIDAVLALQDLNIHAIDVNSRVELKPGLKDIVKVKQIVTAVRNEIHC